VTNLAQAAGDEVPSVFKALKRGLVGTIAALI
jgi:hypothetical protein